jgi:hypothetical protein
MLTRTLIGAALLGGLLTAQTQAQTDPWNRKVEAIAVVPNDTGGHRITAAIGVGSESPSTPLDLGTVVEYYVNGLLIDTQPIGFEVTPAGLPSGCGTACFTFQQCVCCNINGEIICTCGSWFVGNSSTDTQTLQPEDEIMVLLRPAPGALPETSTSDDLDRLVLSNIGAGGDVSPVLWDRRLTSLQTRTHAGGGGYDLLVGMEIAASFDGQLDLDFEIEVLVNGLPATTIPVDVDDLFWNQCLGGCGEACVLDAVGNFYGTCQPIDNYPIPCACQYQPVPIMTVPLIGNPDDDVIVVTLVPVPGALPELPGFEEDEGEIDPNPCPEDLDGDGLVGFGDLTALLSQWGPCAGCPADFDGDDVVGFSDLTALLAKWGPCFPV